MSEPRTRSGNSDDPPADRRGTVHLPGGRLDHRQWAALAELAAAHRGDVRITSRGRVLVTDGPVSARALAEAGLPARVTHERARDIIASPLAGRLPGHHPLADLPEQLDAALLAHQLTGRLDPDVLFGLDDGSGDVLAHGPDLAATAGTDGAHTRIRVAGRDTGVVVPAAHTATVLADAAAALATATDRPGRVPGSGDVHELVVVAVTSHPLATRHDPTPVPRTDEGDAPPTAPRVGWVDTADGLVSLLAVVADGVVPARLAEFLGAIERPSTISADRVIGLHDLTETMAEQVVRVLAPMGLIFDASSPWAAAPSA